MFCLSWDLEEIEEAPQEGQEEGGDNNEEEPVIVTHTPGFTARKKTIP